MDREQAQRVLGLPSGNFTESELAHAYRVKVREHHPDLHGTEHETSMRLINVARDVLRGYMVDPASPAPTDAKPKAAAPAPKPPPAPEPVEVESESAFSFADTGLFRRVQRERKAGPEVWQRRSR